MSQLALPAAALIRHTDSNTLPSSTRRLPALDLATLCHGQARATTALQTAFDIKDKGYHVFAVGEPSLGKRTLIHALLTERAKHEPTPPDLVYVHNFAAPRSPIALYLPAGTAPAFAQKVHKLYHTAKKRLNAKLASERTQKHLDDIKGTVMSAQNQAFDNLNALAIKDDLRLLIRPDGTAEFVPLDTPPSPKHLASPPHLTHSSANAQPNTTATGNKAAKPTAQLQKALLTAEKALDDLELDMQRQLDEYLDGLARQVIEPLFSPLFIAYPQKDIVRYLTALQQDMIKHAERITAGDDEFVPSMISDVPSRYMVNVLSTHEAGSGAPIVSSQVPTHLKLFGYCQHSTELGTVYSDVSMIRAGDLHHAHGGYLVIDAKELFEHPYAYQGLKAALRVCQIRLSALDEMLTMTGTVSLEPEPAELATKVILLGDDALYHELYEYDNDFTSIFGIKADFAHDTARNQASEQALVLKIADIIKMHHLNAFDKSALAAVIDEMSHLSDHQDRLSLHVGRLKALVLEASRQADKAHPDGTDKKTVSAQHVKAAVSERQNRLDYLAELYWQDISSGHQLIATTGHKVGQINALTVLQHADHEFGLPARLTAVIAPKFGAGDILDIERDVELGGSLHAKGMMIMTAFLRAQFSAFYELNFSASLAFEQSYAHIDGDSATLAECCVLLSALADVPINQALAITGSMNQLGDAQAVGGINQKITGFFRVCNERGLTGEQGVIIPRANVINLTLGDDLIKAAQAGKFHIYAVSNVFEALHLLTQIAICDKNKNGHYKKTSLFGKVLARLASWAEDDKSDRGEKHDKKK